VKVHYGSRLARVALPRKYVALTLGDHVFTRLEELEESVLRHEEVHVRQWKRHGLLRFATLYLWYHFRYGYWRNPFEVEARQSGATNVHHGRA
jgi:hypothetical protein